MNFSARTSWNREQNPLALLLENLRKERKTVFDLTISNPTECGIQYPVKEIISAFNKPEIAKYKPDPRGLFFARQTIKQYYLNHSVSVKEENIFLTASTSESYSLLFTLLCNPGESILAPRPSYPLFEYLAQITGVSLKYYPLRYMGGWEIDLEALKQSISSSTKAIILIHPHNPTGMFLKKQTFEEIISIANRHQITLIVDEVFLDFQLVQNEDGMSTTVNTSDVLTFTLSGISKSLGLPQLKLGWIVISGNEKFTHEVGERLEILLDTYLSVNTPVQLALPELSWCGESIRKGILERIKSNYVYVKEFFSNSNNKKSYPCSVLESEGGWYCIIKVPRTQTAEAWAIELLKKHNILVYPGYFYDFDDDGFLVLSLLTEDSTFQNSLNILAEHMYESVR